MFKNTNEKTLGVIGGMGPLATNLFYSMIIENTEAHKDQEHLNMIILSHATMPDRTEAIITENLEPLYQCLLGDAKMLETQGVDAIAIPCNTSHLLADRLQAQLGIPIIHMIRETVCKIEKSGKANGRKVGILATDGTVSTGLYQRECVAHGMIPFTPSEENQRLIMKIIYDGIKNGGEVLFSDFEKVQRELTENHCSSAILGCTELSVFKKMYELSDFYIDAMSVLANESILRCGKKVRAALK